MRGEKFTTIFINNAIYGMTGGQMAPTTLVGQKATTAPLGRQQDHAGAPIRMAEIISTLDGCAYATRVAADTVPHINNVKKAIQKAFRLQQEGKGFTFVEVLGCCPTNWGKTPAQSLEWLQENMIPYYPLGVYKDIEEGVMTNEIMIAGFGGQGVMAIGKTLAEAGMEENKDVCWLPSYGPEMRGGTANCSVVLTDDAIVSPIVLEPTELIAMNLPSLLKFEPTVKAGGTIFVNSSIISEKVTRTDVKAVYVPCLEIAQELGNMKVANMVMLGAYIQAMGNLSFETIKEMLVHMFTGPKAKLVDLNIEALARGAACVK